MQIPPINTAIALPRLSGLLYISAYIPPIIAIGLLAKIPVKKRKTFKAAQLGAIAQAIVNMINMTNVDVIIYFLPNASERGPQSNGPTTYPIKYVEIGRISAADEVTLKYVAIYGSALAGRLDPRVLLMTTTAPMRIIDTFLAFEKLTGLSGSPSSQRMIVLSRELTLVVLGLREAGTLLSSVSIL